ncbi:unnamed protein product, partial [Iphiclides podalirius]
MSLTLGLIIILFISGFFPESQRALATCQGINNCFDKVLKSHKKFVKSLKTEKLRFGKYWRHPKNKVQRQSGYANYDDDYHSISESFFYKD